MRSNISDINLIPIYSDRKLLYSNQCPECEPLVSYLNSEVPSFQFSSKQAIDPLFASIYDCDDQLVGYLFFKETIIEENGEQTFIYTSDYKNTDWGVGVYEARFDINGLEYVSERFCVTDTRRDPQCWLIKWGSNCDSEYGVFTDGYEHKFYIQEIDFEKPVVEKISEERQAADGTVKRGIVSLKTISSFNVCGNDWLYESLAKIELYDNIKLVNLRSGEVFDMDEFRVEASGGDCLYPINISFLKNVATSASCCDIDTPFIDSCDQGGGTISNCQGYDVQINESGGTLTYTETDAPNVQESIQWLLNGAFVGNGSSVTLGAYGSYTVRITRGNCIATDTFIYSDPCANLKLDVNVNGATIAGAANGDDNINISICNSNGDTIGFGLPFTVPLSQGDGTYTVKAVGDNCEAQKALFVKVTPPQICDHEVSISVVNNIITGTVTNCQNLDQQFIELEDENGNITTVSNTNSYTATETGIYWYNAICGGCLQRAYRLVIVEAECLKVEICNPVEVTGTLNVEGDFCCDEENPCECTFDIDCVSCEGSIINKSNCDGVTFNWYDPDGQLVGTGESNIPLDIEGNYEIIATGADCTKSVTYYNDKPNAGTPVANPIIL